MEAIKLNRTILFRVQPNLKYIRNFSRFDYISQIYNRARTLDVT